MIKNYFLLISFIVYAQIAQADYYGRPKITYSFNYSGPDSRQLHAPVDQLHTVFREALAQATSSDRLQMPDYLSRSGGHESYHFSPR